MVNPRPIYPQRYRFTSWHEILNGTVYLAGTDIVFFCCADMGEA